MTLEHVRAQRLKESTTETRNFFGKMFYVRYILDKTTEKYWGCKKRRVNT